MQVETNILLERKYFSTVILRCVIPTNSDHDNLFIAIYGIITGSAVSVGQVITMYGVITGSVSAKLLPYMV